MEWVPTPNPCVWCGGDVMIPLRDRERLEKHPRTCSGCPASPIDRRREPDKAPPRRPAPAPRTTQRKAIHLAEAVAGYSEFEITRTLRANDTCPKCKGPAQATVQVVAEGTIRQTVWRCLADGPRCAVTSKQDPIDPGEVESPLPPTQKVCGCGVRYEWTPGGNSCDECLKKRREARNAKIREAGTEQRKATTTAQRAKREAKQAAIAEQREGRAVPELDLETLVPALLTATEGDVCPKNLRESAVVVVKNGGFPINPVGVGGNRKTQTPCTYRPVGPTCPSSCSFLDAGCYAQQGYTARFANLADPGAIASLTAAAVAYVLAYRLRTVARLHVSGDFLRDGELDQDYLEGLVLLGLLMKRWCGAGVFGWTYTHATRDQLGLWTGRLRHTGGLVVRFSDEWAAGGAVVAKFDQVPELRRQHPGLKLAKCPAQLAEKAGREFPCKVCTLCWTQPDLTIVFAPHGWGRGRGVSTAPIPRPESLPPVVDREHLEQELLVDAHSDAYDRALAIATELALTTPDTIEEEPEMTPSTFVPETRTCEYTECGQTFETKPNHPGQRFCDQSCAGKASYAKSRAAAPEPERQPKETLAPTTPTATASIHREAVPSREPDSMEVFVAALASFRLLTPQQRDAVVVAAAALDPVRAVA